MSVSLDKASDSSARYTNKRFQSMARVVNVTMQAEPFDGENILRGLFANDPENLWFFFQATSPRK